jgi:hypothetical protein
MGVLGRALEVGEVVTRDEPFEFDTQIFPRGCESVSGAAEDPIGEVRGAERGEAREPLLLVRSGVAAFRFDRRHESDRSEIVLCTASNKMVLRNVTGNRGPPDTVSCCSSLLNARTVKR